MGYIRARYSTQRHAAPDMAQQRPIVSVSMSLGQKCDITLDDDQIDYVDKEGTYERYDKISLWRGAIRAGDCF